MKVKLYKYTPHVKSFIENPMLRCTPAYELNDPFELQPNVNTLEEFSKSYSGSYGFNDVAKFLDIRTSDSGVISLSETKSNLLMWSHYADEHKGGVIEFTFDIEFDNQQKLLQRGFLSTIFDNKYLFDRVKYRLEREPDSELFSTPGYELLINLKEHLSFTKAEAWSYEKEHRFLCELNCADLVCVPNNKEVISTLNKFDFKFQQASFNPKLLQLTDFLDNSNDLTIDLNLRLKRQELSSDFKQKNKSMFHFYRVNPNCVTGVYLGCKSASELTGLFSDEKLMKKFQYLAGNINKAKLCGHRYEMVFEKIA